MSGRPTEEQVRVRYRDSEGGRMNRWFAILTKEFIWNRLHCNSNTSKMKPIVTGFASNPVLLSVCELYVLIMAHTTVVNIMSGLFGHLPTSFSRFSSASFPVLSNRLKVVEPPRLLPERGGLLLLSFALAPQMESPLFSEMLL